MCVTSVQNTDYARHVWTFVVLFNEHLKSSTFFTWLLCAESRIFFHIPVYMLFLTLLVTGYLFACLWRELCLSCFALLWVLPLCSCPHMSAVNVVLVSGEWIIPLCWQLCRTWRNWKMCRIRLMHPVCAIKLWKQV